MFFNRIFNIGVLNVNSDIENKRIKILNVIVCISLFHAIFFLIFDYAMGSLNLQKEITLSIEVLMFSSILFLQYKGKFKLARLLFTCIVFANLFYNCNYAFKGYYGEYQYIVIPLFSLFFFDKKYIHYSLLFFAIVAFYVPNFYFNLYPEKYFGYLNVFLFFIGIFLIVNFFKNLNDKNEKLLEIEKNKVTEDKIVLEMQQKELRELNDFKTHFFVNLSHEIKTPLTLIKGYSSRINLNSEDTANVKSLEVIKNQTQYIQDIVDNILDLSKLESNKLEVQTKYTDVKSFITSIYADFDGVFKTKNISFILENNVSDISVRIDPIFFKKSINNLLHNALKFTHINGKVILRIKLDNDTLKINVIDNGIGIPQKDITNVFNRFYQSKNDITKSQGSGIGLAFAKNIIETHGFSLNLKSTPNIETIFTVSIPSDAIITNKKENITQNTSVNTPVKQISDSEVLQKKNLSDKTILLVEDNNQMRNYLKLILKEYHIVEAINGKEGLKELKKYDFDIIITDYMMPVMDGLSFVKELKKQAVKIPVIVITARSDDKGKLDILRLGIDSYITKPFLEEELLLNVKKSIYFYEEITKIKKTLPDSEKLQLADEEQVFYKQLIAIVETNYNNKNFGVDDLATELKLSRSSLFRKTKLFLGQTPNDVIAEIRFQKAKEILENRPKINKKDLAEAVGVYNATYFYKKMEKRFLGKT